jgi:hypothetical protein
LSILTPLWHWSRSWPATKVVSWLLLLQHHHRFHRPLLVIGRNVIFIMALSLTSHTVLALVVAYRSLSLLPPVIPLSLLCINIAAVEKMSPSRCLPSSSREEFTRRVGKESRKKIKCC